MRTHEEIRARLDRLNALMNSSEGAAIMYTTTHWKELRAEIACLEWVLREDD